VSPAPHRSVRQRTVLSVAGLLAAAAVLVWAAATGPVGVFGEWHPQPSDFEPREGWEDQPPGYGAPRDEEPPGMGATPGGEGNVDWLDDLLAVGVLVGALLLLRSAWPLLADWVRRLLPRRHEAVELEPVADPERARDALVRDEDRRRSALSAGEARAGIVACWVTFEEAAEAAGLPRRRSETPTEFVVALLHALDVDPRPVGVLAGLYHEARFSTHPMHEDSRARAEDALAAIHRDLRVRVG
jgi:hypothetical protein